MYLPVTSSSPLSAIKVSRPQHLMNPVEKWGRPAAREAEGSTEGRGGGRWAEWQSPKICTDPRARSVSREEPCWMNL